MKFLSIIVFVGLTNIFANNLVEIVLPHNQWKLIGVSGAFMEGSGTTDITTGGTWYYATNTNGGFWKGLENTAGTSANYTPVTHLVGFAIDDHNGNSEPSSVLLSFNPTNFSIDTTLPRRKMYLSADDTGIVDVNITYQSDLEGEVFDVKMTLNSVTTVYTGYFNSSYGENNPLSPTAKTGISSNTSFKIRDIIDMDLTNNPGKDGQSGNLYDYVRGSHRDGLEANDNIKIFRLDSKNSIWESFYSEVDDNANDFTTLTSGSAYWVKLYDDTETTIKHGLILGDGNISLDTYSSNYYALSDGNNTSRYKGHSLLSAGWNMLSFPDGEIRFGGTGLIVKEQDASAGKEFTLTDEVGKEIVYISIFDTDDNGDIGARDIAISTNNAIASAKEDGNISTNFNIRAYSNGEDNEYVIFISDRKFRIYEKDRDNNNDPIFRGVTTLGGQNPYKLSTNSYETVDNLDQSGVASKYGEYALVLTINNDGAGDIAGSLLSANQDMGKVQINNNDGININETALGDTKVSSSDDKFSADSDIDYDFDFDLDLDGKMDSVLLVNTSSPFYIRDHTFTKVFRLDGDPTSASGNIYVDKEGNSNFTTVALGNSVANTVSALDTALTTADIDSKEDGNYIFMTTVNSDYRNFDIKEAGTDDNLTRVISNNPLALGAITKVYSISDLAKSDINKSVYSVTITTVSGGTDGDDNISVTIDGEDTGDVLVIDDNESGSLCYALKTAINNFQANVYADCSSSDISTDKNLTSKLTIKGYFSKAGIRVEDNDGGGGDISTDGDNNNQYDYSSDWESASLGGVALKNTTTLTNDLRYNPIYSPNYPTSNGILKYIRENNYKVKAMLTAINDKAGSISWKYIDLTVDTDQLFSQFYDYSLFTTEIENGYFALLESSTASKLTLTPTLSMNFYQYYNSDSSKVSLSEAGNVDNFFDGTLTAILSGDEGENSQVVATIQNRDYTLLKNGNSYSLELTRDNFPEIAMSDSNIILTAYDETGNIEINSTLELNLSSPAKPVIQFFNGKHMFVGTTSSDLSAFNIYSGKVDDRYPIPNNKDSSTYVKNLNPTNDYKTNNIVDYGNSNQEFGVHLTLNGVNGYGEGNVTEYNSNSVGKVVRAGGSTYYFMTYNICEDSPNFDSNNIGWLITTVDGDGDATKSRVSNITFVDDWYSIYKNASILTVNQNTATDNKPRLYGTDCNTSSTSNNIQDNGVVLTTLNTKSIVNGHDYNVTIAYDTISTSPMGTNSPHTVFLCLEGTNVADDAIAEVQFSKNIYTTSLNKSLTSAKTLLIHYIGKNDANADINQIYKTDFDKLYATASGECIQIDNLANADTVGASGQTIIKGD